MGKQVHQAEDAVKLVNKVTFETKKPRGDKKYNAKAKKISYKKETFYVQMGSCPYEDSDDEMLVDEEREKVIDERTYNILQTKFGPSVYDPKKDKKSNESMTSTNNDDDDDDENEGGENTAEKNKAPSLDIVMKRDSAAHKFYTAFEEHLLAECKANPLEWINKDSVTEEVMDELLNSIYTPNLKEDAMDDNVLVVKAKIMRTTKYSLCDRNRKITRGTASDLKKGCKFTIIVFPALVWFLNKLNTKTKVEIVKGFGVTWYVDSVMIYEADEEEEFSFVLPEKFKVEKDDKEEAAEADNNNDQDAPATSGSKRKREFMDMAAGETAGAEQQDQESSTSLSSQKKARLLTEDEDF